MASINSTLETTHLLARLQKLLKKGRRVKTPTLLQMEAVECGAAALGIILGYYGRFVPLTELRNECGVSRDGSKASDLVKAAARYGLQAKGFKKKLEQLQDLHLPYIVFWNFNHFVVVEGWSKQWIYLNDPANGPQKVSLEEFKEGYTGVVLVMEPGSQFKKGGRRTSITLSLWSRLQGSISALLYCVFTGFLLTIVGLAVPVFSQVFVDEILIQGRRNWLHPLLIGMILTAFLQGVLALLRLRHLRQLKAKLAVGMSSRFLWHILRLPVNFYTQRFAGEISYRTSLNDDVADALSGRLAIAVIDTVMAFFFVLVMFQYDAILSLITVSFAAVNFLTLQWVSRQRIDENQRLKQEYGKVAGTSIAALESIETLKASGLESYFFSRWAGHYAKVINIQQDLGVINQVFSVLPPILSALSSILLLIVGSLRVMDGYLSIGMLVAFQGLMLSFLEPVNNLLNFGTTLQELEGNLIRLDDVLENPIDPQVEQRSRGATSQQGSRGEFVSKLFWSPLSQEPLAPLPKLQGYIELQNVTFGYSRVEPPLIENFSLSIKPGQRVALVGGSGSGKSTIAKLVCGLYEPWAGEVLFDGRPRVQISHQQLTNSIAMVEQEIMLFSGTVRENLTLWDTTVLEKNLVRACQDAAIEDVILSLPEGYDAELIEGAANLSGGQRQRLEIARALAINPSITIMDEATSALDAQTEKIIDCNLRRRGCTCLVVAHRLSTIRDCDEIIVLESGKVVQRGTHEELWQMKGVYSRLICNEE